ncbi:hypothetical protein GPECTOR_2g1081 [Gonium pectorale]|uniref:Uncharacterized protein n=1 Tax=Gonium pectorale TaxID=33097 RepID=A0A150H0M3_GONPE|nr:hypothetical protein GPECTOR_2g1081 [Gonium pectorale]|eukprot:KXZ55532.1 hypothetical protein GPECTOR_2g1081 [Gonium pectorale]
MVWLRKKLEEARGALGGEAENLALAQRARALLPALRAGAAGTGLPAQAGRDSLLPPAARAALWEGREGQR